MKHQRKSTYRIRLIIVLLMITCWSHAQNISISNIPILEQLPVNAIHRIFQDSEGYMWYGTVDGLCRDDGYQVQVFRSDIYTPHILLNNTIVCMTEDKEGKLWFGTDNGAYILNKKGYRIFPLDASRLQGEIVHRMDASSDGYIWATITGALLKYRLDGTLVKEYEICNESGKANVEGFCENRNGEILITISDDKPYLLDKETDTFQPFPDRFRQHNLTSLIQDREHDYYWLFTWGDGIIRFDPKAKEDSMYVYQPMPRNAFGKEDGIILYGAQDDVSGYIWVTTNTTLHAFKPDERGMLEQVDLSGLIPHSNLMLNEIRKNNQGDLWVSAFDSPSFIIRFQEDALKDYSLPAIRRQVNNNPAVMALHEAGEDIMWISQERTGLFLYDLANDKACCYTDCNATKNLPLNAIIEITGSHSPGEIWTTPFRSSQVMRLARQGMEMKLVNNIDFSSHISDPDRVEKLLEDGRRRLWIGTTKGIYQYDIKHETVHCICDTLGYVSDITEAASGEIWVCTTDKGLYRISPEGEYTSIPLDLNFSSLTMTTDGIIWLGTEAGGIYAYNPQNGEFQDYSRKCGMNGNRINQMASDAFNHLWIDTNQAIIEFNPRNGSYSTYLTNDESMLLWRLIPTAICKGENGDIYFGGIPGICVMTPSNRLDSAAKPVKTLITDVSVMNKSLIFGQQEEEISLSHIQLTPDARNLRINFSSLNYHHTTKVKYAYRLSGVDEEWIYTNCGENSAFYNQLEKGSYTFQVKATDENGLWSHEVTELAITRLPAFYETWWAYMFYSIFIVAVIGNLLYAYLRHMKRKGMEMWADSKEMVNMYTYLSSKTRLPEPEFIQLDKLLLEKATKAVEENLSEPDFDVTALASAANMSRSTLTRKLKAITGRTPLEFIRNIKMEYAKQMLKDKDRSVTEIATTLGYQDRKYFTSCFKEESGMTPSEFRKSLPTEKENE